MAAHLLSQGKNGVSAAEIQRNLGVTYKTAWFMMHRLREAMSELVSTPMGGEGQSVQADETYYGNTSKRKGLQERPLAQSQHRRSGRTQRPGPRVPY